MVRSLVLRALSVALVLGTAGRAAAAEFPEVLFILDSSGSMQEPAGAERKIDAAKRVMAEVVPALESEVRVGLVAYGHRSPGDCSDIETLITAGSDDRNALLARVNSLQPVGKTPISAALIAAANQLKGKDAVTSIVLVSDGIETCAGDPCEVVRQLKSAGVKFVLHTVGFNVDAAAASQLQCMADGGGGQYFAAADGDSLLVALRTVSEQVAEQVEAARVTTVNSGTGLGKLEISMPDAATQSLAGLEVIRVSDGAVVKTVKHVDATSLHLLGSGDYQVAALFSTPNMGQPTRSDWGVVTVRKGETRKLQLGALALNVPEELAKAEWGQRLELNEIIIVDSGTERVAARVRDSNNGYYNYLAKPLPPGIYDLRFLYDHGTEVATTVAKQLVVQPGRTTTATLDSGLQLTGESDDVVGARFYRRVEQTADAAEDGAQPAPARELVLEARATGLSINGRPGRNDALWFPYLLPPGEYDIEIDVHGMTESLPAGEAVRVAPGELMQFDLGL